MRQRIKYITYFDFQDSSVRRNYVTSATNKIESICDCLGQLGVDVKIISASQVVEPRFSLYRGSDRRVSEFLSLKTFFSWGGTNKLLSKLRTLWHLVALFFYLLLHTKRDETVIVYHSLGYILPVYLAKKIRRFRLILEVEEIYQDVLVRTDVWSHGNEYRVIAAADAYIFPTELLNQKLNNRHKPCVIIHGSYKVNNIMSKPFDDGKIHVVYAGTFDPRKGVLASIDSAEYLSEKYHVHVMGFGSRQEVDDVRKRIDEVRSTSKAEISYEGLLKGDDYNMFIQRCQIGLSTQDPTAAFNATSFPSKILSYMANGLSVVSIDIPAVRSSAVGSRIVYYQQQTPAKIAEAIMKASDGEGNREFVRQLEKNFVKEISELLSECSF